MLDAIALLGPAATTAQSGNGLEPSRAGNAADALEAAAQQAGHVRDALPQVADEARSVSSDLLRAIRDAKNLQVGLETAARAAGAATDRLPPSLPTAATRLIPTLTAIASDRP